MHQGFGRPAQICEQLLTAMDGSEGRRKRRKRNTTPDALGLQLKRELLERAITDDPEPEAFEEWLASQCLAAGPAAGSMQAMALDVRDEWKFAQASESFRRWLAEGAPTDDAT